MSESMGEWIHSWITLGSIRCYLLWTIRVIESIIVLYLNKWQFGFSFNGEQSVPFSLKWNTFYGSLLTENVVSTVGII